MSQAELSRSVSSTERLLLRIEVEDFLAQEAALLDERKFRDWFALLDDDLEYWMPVRTTRAKVDEDSEFAKIGEGAFFDETKPLIEERIRKLETPYCWAEDPPSRTRHINTNIRIVAQPKPNEVEVACNFILYRGRLANHQDIWVGSRHDSLRRHENGWKIYKRHIFIDQVSLLAKNLSVFF